MGLKKRSKWVGRFAFYLKIIMTRGEKTNARRLSPSQHVDFWLLGVVGGPEKVVGWRWVRCITNNNNKECSYARKNFRMI